MNKQQEKPIWAQLDELERASEQYRNQFNEMSDTEKLRLLGQSKELQQQLGMLRKQDEIRRRMAELEEESKSISVEWVPINDYTFVRRERKKNAIDLVDVAWLLAFAGILAFIVF
jgi:hypothetical protein